MNNAVSKQDYEKASPYEQGYTTYMQGAWNPEVPNFNPYRVGTEARKEFERGEFQAMLDVQDSED